MAVGDEGILEGVLSGIEIEPIDDPLHSVWIKLKLKSLVDERDEFHGIMCYLGKSVKITVNEK